MSAEEPIPSRYRKPVKPQREYPDQERGAEQQPDLLWLGLPLFLYWLARTWVLAHRGEVHDDPVLFALRDRVSYVVLALFALTIALAS